MKTTVELAHLALTLTLMRKDRNIKVGTAMAREVEREGGGGEMVRWGESSAGITSLRNLAPP